MIIKALRIFSSIWYFLVGLFWLGNIVFTWRDEGFSAVQALLSPFNVIYYIALMATSIPGFVASTFADKLEKKMAVSAK